MSEKLVMKQNKNGWDQIINKNITTTKKELWWTWKLNFVLIYNFLIKRSQVVLFGIYAFANIKRKKEKYWKTKI